MKKLIALLLSLLLLPFPALCETALTTPQAVIDHLLHENATYAAASANTGDVSLQKRQDTALNGQFPYAVIVTCSDSRVPAEHIFDAGIGELFVIRTAGNVIGEYELGSVEYGAEHLHAPLVLVLGHTQCGAVDAALNGGAHGFIAKITDEIRRHLPEGCTAREAEVANVRHSIERIMESEMMQRLVASGTVAVRGAIYDIATGTVALLP